MDIREKMRRDWDRRARIDARYWVAATPDATPESYEASGERDATALLEGLRGRVAPEARVLDLGCGMGRLAGHVARRFAQVDGIDISPAMVEAAREAHAHVPNLAFHVTSGADLADLGDETFDLVYSYAVLSHVPFDVVRAYFHEIARVLKPDGWFRYQFWIGRDQPAGETDTISIRVYTPEQVQGLHQEAGLALHEIDEIDYFDPVLHLKPVWVNARKTGRPAGPRVEPVARAEGADPGGQALEYELLLYLALKHGERGEMVDAERVLAEAVDTDPSRPEGYIQWAAWRLEGDDVAGARKLFEAATERAPDCAPAWLYRAQMAALEDDRPAAAAALRTLAALKDVPTEVVREAAVLRRRLNRPRRR